MGLQIELARLSRAVTYGAVPDEIRAVVRQCVLDTIGVAIAGAEEELSRILAAELGEQGGPSVAGVPGMALRLPARSAACPPMRSPASPPQPPPTPCWGRCATGW